MHHRRARRASRNASYLGATARQDAGFREYMLTDNIPLFPVATISAGPVLQHRLVTIRFDFLTNLMQSPSEAMPGRHYALSPVQALYLQEQIQRALDLLEKTPEQAPPGTQH